MIGYLVIAEDIRGHFCLGRVFVNREKADKYCEYVNTEMMDKHVDTAEGGHYFIYNAEVVQVEMDDEDILQSCKQDGGKV